MDLLTRPAAEGRVEVVTSSDIWGAETAMRYDAELDEMGTAAVLGPTLDFLAGLAGRGRALEFAIGTGRVGVGLARRGVPVAGIEYSPHMLAQLRVKIGPEGLPVVEGDMATATVPGEFSLVYLVFNTIMNLLTQDEQVACFANAARHLSPGGHFVVECMVPRLRSLPPGQLAHPFEVSERHLGFDTYDLVDQRLTSQHFHPDGDGYRRSSSDFRYVWPAELDLMARLAGLRLVKRVADWDDSTFTDDATSHVSVWQK